MPRIACYVVGMVLLLVACVKSGPAHETGGRGDTAGGDSGTDGADTALNPAPCGDWSGVQRIGSAWVYDPTDAYVEEWGFDGSGSVEVTGIVGATVTLVSTGRYEGDSGYFAWSRTESWRCDADGAWWTRSEAASEGRSGTYEFGTSGVRTFDPGWLIRPADATVGVSWTDAFVQTVDLDGSDPASTEVACSSVVVEEATRTVDAGALLARRVAVDCGSGGGLDVWLQEGVGMIEDEDQVLASYEP